MASRWAGIVTLATASQVYNLADLLLAIDPGSSTTHPPAPKNFAELSMYAKDDNAGIVYVGSDGTTPVLSTTNYGEKLSAAAGQTWGAGSTANNEASRGYALMADTDNQKVQVDIRVV